MRIINTSQPNDNLGTVLRESFNITNENFAELDAKKVDKVAGEGLTPNKYTTEEQQKLAQIEAKAQVNVIPDMAQEDPTKPDFIKNKYKLLASAGYFDYNNTLPPIAVVANTPLKLTNNGLGAQTKTTAPPYGVTSTWKVFDNTFDFSQLAVDDMVDIRVDCDLTTTSSNQSYRLYINMGVGSANPFSINITRGQEKTAGTFSVIGLAELYIGGIEARNYPAELFVVSDGNGTIKVNGWYIRIIRKNLNIIDVNDNNALHKSGNESFTGIKTANNTDATPAGFDISNNRTFRERATNIWQNLLDGFFNKWDNLSNGVFNYWYNYSTGVFNNWNNYSTGIFNNWHNTSTGIFNSWYNLSTGIFARITAGINSTGDLFQFFKDTVKTASINHLGHFISNKFINPTGQGFLKANGDIDTNTYKLDTPNLHQFSTTAFSGVAQKGYVDIPLGTAVAGKLDVTIYTAFDGENISASTSATIDVLYVNGTVYRNELKHKEANPLITSKYQIIGLINVNNSLFLRINKLSAVENMVAVSVNKTGFNPNNGYSPTKPLPFVQDDTVVATDVLNVKNVNVSPYTISPNDWVNTDKTLLVKGNYSGGTITLAPANLTKGLITRVVNNNINVGTLITVKGALTGDVTIAWQRTASFISDGVNNYQI